jgi:hypothetical protein
MSWGPINLSGSGGKLPPAGAYAAAIADFRMFEKPDVIWCAVDVALDGTNASLRGVLHAIAATDDSRYAGRVAEGLRFLQRLSLVVGVAIEGVNYEQYPALFLGKRLEVIVAHSARDGVPELVVCSMRPLPVPE